MLQVRTGHALGPTDHDHARLAMDGLPSYRFLGQLSRTKEFVVPSHTEYYTDLSQSYLYLKCRVLIAEGTNLEAAKKVSPVNNFFHSMFNSVDWYVNNKMVTSNMNTKPYRGYLEILFSYGSDMKDNH